MRFPWGQKKDSQELGFFSAPQTQEIEEIALHKSLLCAEMASILTRLESLDCGRVDTEAGYFNKYPPISRTPLIEGLVVYINDTQQRITVRTETTQDINKVNLALNHSFPLEVKYRQQGFDEAIELFFDNHPYELDEQLVFNALRKFYAVLDAEKLEGEQLPRSSRNHKRTSIESNNVLKLVS